MLLIFLPEKQELQHTLQLHHKLPDPGLHEATQPPSHPVQWPMVQPVSMQVPGAGALGSWCPTPPVCEAAGGLEAWLQGWWGSGGHSE